MPEEGYNKQPLLIPFINELLKEFSSPWFDTISCLHSSHFSFLNIEKQQYPPIKVITGILSRDEFMSCSVTETSIGEDGEGISVLYWSQLNSKSDKQMSTSFLSFNFRTDNKRSFFSHSYTWRKDTTYVPPASCLYWPKRASSESVWNFPSRTYSAPYSSKH